MLIRWPKRRHVFLFLLANVAAIVAGYALLFSSEPYEFAKNFVASDPRVLQVTGAQTAARLNVLKARATMGDRTGEARFIFGVQSERGDFDVLIEMEKRSGLWSATKVQAISDAGANIDIVDTQ